VDARVRHQIRLELGNVHVQGSVEPEGSCEGRDDLRNEAVEVGVCGTLDVEVATADVVAVLMCRWVCLKREDRVEGMREEI